MLVRRRRSFRSSLRVCSVLLLILPSCGLYYFVVDGVRDFVVLGSSEIVVSLGNGTVLASADDGATWERRSRTSDTGTAQPAIDRLVMGEGDSVWGRLVLGGVVTRTLSLVTSIVVSQDAGRSFIVLADPNCFNLVHREGQHPLFQCGNSELMEPVILEDGTLSTREFAKLPASTESNQVFVESGLGCGRELYLAMRAGPTLFRSSDDGETWVEVCAETPTRFPSLACGSDGLWIVTDAAYYLQHDSTACSKVADLPFPNATQAVSYQDVLYVLDNCTFYAESIAMISRDGQVSLLPRPNSERVSIRVDPTGRLLAAARGLYRWREQDERWQLLWP